MMKQKLTFVIVLFSWLLSFVGCTSTKSIIHPSVKIVTKEYPLGKRYPDSGRLLAVSPDSKRLAYSFKRGGKEIAVIDGLEGKGYDSIDSLVFSPDSKRVAYKVTHNGKQIAIIDRKEWRKYDLIENWGFLGNTTKDIVYSKNSKRFAYKAKMGRKWFAVIDGFEGKKYQNIDCGAFSPDSRRIAYTARKAYNQAFLVVDGVEGKQYNGAFTPIFSPDSKHIAYMARLKHEEDYRTGKLKQSWTVVLDGIEGDEYDKVGNLLFSLDSKRLFYSAIKDGKEFAIINGNKSIGYDASLKKFSFLGISSGGKYWKNNILGIFSPDSMRLAYIAMRGKKWHVVVDGKEGNGYDAIGEWFWEGFNYMIFSPDSKRIAYKAKRGDKWFVVVDGVEGEEYDAIGSPLEGHHIVFSPDGKRVGYKAKRGDKSFIVIDGIKGKQYDECSNPSFSRDSWHVAYKARRGKKEFSVIDGVEGEEYDYVWSIDWFTPDSKRVIYIARRCKTEGPQSKFARAIWKVLSPKSCKDFVVVNGIEHVSYDFIYTATFSLDSKNIAYSAERRGKVFVIVNNIEGEKYDGFIKGSKLVFDNNNSLHTLVIRGEEFLRSEMSIFGE